MLIICYICKIEIVNAMGIFVNPGNKDFYCTLNSFIYVDKTMMIAEVNKLFNSRENFMCVSRPRRFGKSIAVGMLVAYYSKGCDSREMFSNLKIAQDPGFESHLNKCNVIHFDLNKFWTEAKNSTKLFDNVEIAINKELQEEFPDVEIDVDSHLSEVILTIYQRTGQQFIFFMDEYDVLLREKVSAELFELYLDFLRRLFKNNNLRQAFNLAYLTGILPIVRDRIQSKLNEFDEYTIMRPGPLAEFTGITYDETKALCAKYDMDFDECKRWYDGYVVNDFEIFAPKSVVSSMRLREYYSYWGITGSYEVISEYINLDFDGILNDVQQMLAGKSVSVNVLSFMNTITDFHSKHDVFTYLIHLGYLGYLKKEKRCFIPNYEVRIQWELAIERASNFSIVAESIRDSEELLERTLDGDAGFVAEALNKAHKSLCHPLKYNNESAFQVSMVMAYYTARNNYFVVQEFPSGRGFADIALIPFQANMPAVVVELKVNGTSGLALSQIHKQEYDTAFRNYRGDVLFVGVSYDKETGVHECKMERVVR